MELIEKNMSQDKSTEDLCEANDEVIELKFTQCSANVMTYEWC